MTTDAPTTISVYEHEQALALERRLTDATKETLLAALKVVMDAMPTEPRMEVLRRERDAALRDRGDFERDRAALLTCLRGVWRVGGDLAELATEVAVGVKALPDHLRAEVER